MKNALDEFIDSGFPIGRMISGSKSGYVDRNPGNLAVFNANLCTKEHGKIWYGDLDVTKDTAALQKLAHGARCDLYVLRESDARFDNEHSPRFECAVAVFSSTTPLAD